MLKSFFSQFAEYTGLVVLVMATTFGYQIGNSHGWSRGFEAYKTLIIESRTDYMSEDLKKIKHGVRRANMELCQH